MTQEQAADEFVAQYNGKYIDEDYHFGSQCWDVVARYAREKWGCPYFPTGSGGAEGLWRLFYSPIPDYFTKVPNTDLKKGDIAVWDASFYPPYGHTSLVWEREGNYIWSFEQDGSKDPNGDGIADGVSYLVRRLITGKLSGGLRPKGGSASMSTLGDYEIDALCKGFFGYPASQADINESKGKESNERIRWFFANNAYTAREKTMANLEQQVADLTKENAALKEQIANGAGGDFVPAGELYIKKTK